MLVLCTLNLCPPALVVLHINPFKVGVAVEKEAPQYGVSSCLIKLMEKIIIYILQQIL